MEHIRGIIALVFLGFLAIVEIGLYRDFKKMKEYMERLKFDEIRNLKTDCIKLKKEVAQIKDDIENLKGD